MDISFDAQPLLYKYKTGISYCESGLVNELINNHPEDKFSLQYFSLENCQEQEKALTNYVKENVVIDNCRFFPGKIYKLITLLFPLPYKWFFKSRSDVTHFFNYIVPPFVYGKTVVTVHDLTYLAYPETMERSTRLILKLTAKRSMERADKIIAVSEFTKKELEARLGIAAPKIEVVYNAVDSEIFRNDIAAAKVESAKEKYGICGEYFLYVGTLEPRKNLERLLNAYAMLSRNYPEFPCMVLVGKKGWLFEQIFENTKRLGIENKVIFTDYVPAEDVPPLMKGAKVFCYPSLYEGCGMPVIEAMACGTPVLTSKNSSMEEVSGGCALLAEAKSTESIKEGLEKLYLDSELREKLSQSGMIQARKFSWEKEAEKLHEIYVNL